MKNLELCNLQELSFIEAETISGGGIIYDFFHSVGETVGTCARKVVDYLYAPTIKDPHNASTLSSGTYYGR